MNDTAIVTPTLVPAGDEFFLRGDNTMSAKGVRGPVVPDAPLAVPAKSTRRAKRGLTRCLPASWPTSVSDLLKDEDRRDELTRSSKVLDGPAGRR